MHCQQGINSSHRLRGAVVAVNLYPGYAKNAYPGLMYLHASGVASPKGCTELSPGAAFCATPGVSNLRENHTPARCKDYFGQPSPGGEGFIASLRPEPEVFPACGHTLLWSP